METLALKCRPPTENKTEQEKASGHHRKMRRIRRIIAEDPDWSLSLVPDLSTLCLQYMVNNFVAVARLPIFQELSTTQKSFIEERLSPALPLHVTANLVSDGVYWKRCCEQRWDLCDVSYYGHSWKRMFFERHLENIIELFIPGVTEPKTLLELVPLCVSYVKRLNIAQLLVPVKEPVKQQQQQQQEEEEDCDSDLDLELEHTGLQMDHFDFGIILDKLTNLEELHLVYRIKQCGMNFEWKMFEMTDQDCELLAKALKSCSTLRLLRLRDSHVKDRECRQLVKSLLDHPSLTELDFSYNLIGDGGARGIGKLLSRSKLEVLNLCCNRVSSLGAKALARALSKNATLLSLNLRLNNLTDEGGQAIGKALMGNTTLRHLHLGGTGVTWPTAVALSKVLAQNDTLKSINLSCNKLGEAGGKALEEAMTENTSVTECDLRQTGVDEQSLGFINVKVGTNFNSEHRKQLKERKKNSDDNKTTS